MTGGLGPWGAGARVVVGLALVGDVTYGHWSGGWHPASWLLAFVGLPAIAVAAMWLRARWSPAPLDATGPVGHAVNTGIFLALYLTWWYAPALEVTSDAALLFYGASMLAAAAAGHGCCEVLVAPNILLRRDDRVGCTLFWPVDAAEARLRRWQAEDAR